MTSPTRILSGAILSGAILSGAILFGAMLCGLLAAAPAAAQRNGNVANGQNYQPTPGQVNGAEAATGVAPTPGQQAREAGAVDDVYKQLLGHDRPGSAANPSPVPSAAPGPSR